KLVLKQGKMIGYFVADQNSAFYQSEQFRKVLTFVQNNPMLCRLKEKETKKGLRLLLTFDQVKSIDKALNLIYKINENENNYPFCVVDLWHKYLGSARFCVYPK